MSQILESHYSDEDFQLINKYHLGHPLRTYRPTFRSLRSAYLWSLAGVILCLLFSIGSFLAFLETSPDWSLPFRIGTSLGCVVVAAGVVGLAAFPDLLSKVTQAFMMLDLVVALVLGVLVQFYVPDASLLPLFLLAQVLMGFMGGITLFTSRHDGRKMRLIVCDAGLLTVRKTSWDHRVQVLLWKDTRLKKMPFGREAWRIVPRGQEPLGILASAISASDYQDEHELIASIAERIAEPEK